MTAPRVLHLYNVFGLGTERAWLEYPLALGQRGFSLRFACEQVAPEAPAILPPPVQLPRIAVQAVQAAGDIDAQMTGVIASAQGDPARAALLAEPIDLVHGHFGPRLLHAAAWLARGVPVVISLYGYDASRLLRDPAWLQRYRWMAERGAVFTVLCRAMRERLLAGGLPADRVRILRLGIQPQHWPFEPAPAPTVPRFVFVGRLTPKKAPGDLVAALALLHARGLPAQAEIIGDGPLAADLARQVQQAGLAPHVTLTGALPRAAIPARLAAATAFVLPSRTAPDGDEEGTPVALMEAAARGLPCVTTHHAGNPEVLPPEAETLGLIAPEGDPAALARALERTTHLSPDARSYLQQAGRRHIEAQHTLAGTVAGYEALYRELLGRYGAGA